MRTIKDTGLDSVRMRCNGRSVQLYKAHSFWQRAIGLIGLSELHANEGLWLSPCNSIHTFGMQYRIDVVFLSKSLSVRKVVHAVPNEFYACAEANSVLELRSGTCHRLLIDVGCVWQRENNEACVLDGRV